MPMIKQVILILDMVSRSKVSGGSLTTVLAGGLKFKERIWILLDMHKIYIILLMAYYLSFRYYSTPNFNI